MLHDTAADCDHARFQRHSGWPVGAVRLRTIGRRFPYLGRRIPAIRRVSCQRDLKRIMQRG
nr:MAG TPA: hypothetical protein [Caudoviricetes sp.]